MATARHLAAVAQPPTDSAEPASPTSEALASFLRHLANRRGRSGRISSRPRRALTDGWTKIDAQRGTWTPSAEELAARMATH
ncbi:hypothetical protein [Saccharopolyspora shandongensis]|uniref:hypothetical protein n=1 Tax=Saccharopolyspora shandongensis TaxID=418495 RepID=UPI00340E55AE